MHNILTLNHQITLIVIVAAVHAPPAVLSQEEIRRRRLAYLENQEARETLNPQSLNT